MSVSGPVRAMAGVRPSGSGEAAGTTGAGKDMTPRLKNPGTAGPHALRESVPFTYSGLWRMDDDAKEVGKNPKLEIIERGFIPNARKRGSPRMVFEGRRNFTRYFSPRDRNQPPTLDDRYDLNDVELFDLETDPNEMVNLAIDGKINARSFRP